MPNVKIKIDGIEIEVPKGSSILEAARKTQIEIPALCNHKDLTASGSCGLCIVDIENLGIKRSCITEVVDGMVINTNNEEIRRTRKNISWTIKNKG